jgi:hypothetical protein
MAKVVVTASHDWRKICELAGGDTRQIMHDPATNELEVPDVTQAALDTALSDYEADQANIDAATAAARETVHKEHDKALVDQALFVALIEGLVGEINLLRAEHGMPARTLAQVKDYIKSRIDAG